MPLLSERFPTDISYGSTGGPSYKTRIISTASGFEYRNRNWQKSRHKYNAATGIQTEDNLDDLISFFHLAAGKYNTFRFKDYKDFKTCKTSQNVAQDDVTLIADAVGGETEVQLFKTYTVGAISVNRDIIMPIASTLLLAINDILQVQNTDYTIDDTTGIVTFTDPLTANDFVTCGFEFDVLCRFDVDELPISLDAYKVGSTNIQIVEAREVGE